MRIVMSEEEFSKKGLEILDKLSFLEISYSVKVEEGNRVSIEIHEFFELVFNSNIKKEIAIECLEKIISSVQNP